ncbi:hypothetical protein CANARDRAFT_204625 [[Candida] arabinofermentans NRRL YB-2248]|uniref:Phytanoyl-CoA dioxygenase n=1 Tax=[Candida] arabinofermentans NRRL YB-2248 TaxID=983967 RepID=A0A1E4ST95_9ASCO|nr:hypothetical protein CANARDRAFT_204625 [[Candida] arabinofermentans NRRL YB-2248]
MDADIEDVVTAMKKAGGCIIKGVASAETLAAIDKELRPIIDADVSWDGDFFPSQTKRATGIVGHSPEAAKMLLQNRIYRETCDAFLAHNTVYYVDNEQRTGLSPPQLNNSICFSIGPGATAQPLHRDDGGHHPNYDTIEEYPEDMNNFQRDAGVGFFVAGTKATKANGATRFIPGSHLWGVSIPPKIDMVYYAEMDPGDAFMMLSSCYHGGSANTTKDERRELYSCFMTRGYLRQEENQYLAHSLDKVKNLPLDLKKVFGYQMSNPAIGWLDHRDPIFMVAPELKQNNFVI